jgi:hypothetical protein
MMSNMIRILGLVVLVVGIALVVIGMNASHSLADQVSNTFTGRFTQVTTWYIVGGLAAGALGVGMLAMGGKK